MAIRAVLNVEIAFEILARTKILLKQLFATKLQTEDPMIGFSFLKNEFLLPEQVVHTDADLILEMVVQHLLTDFENRLSSKPFRRDLNPEKATTESLILNCKCLLSDLKKLAAYFIAMDNLEFNV